MTRRSAVLLVVSVVLVGCWPFSDDDGGSRMDQRSALVRALDEANVVLDIHPELEVADIAASACSLGGEIGDPFTFLIQWGAPLDGRDQDAWLDRIEASWQERGHTVSTDSSGDGSDRYRRTTTDGGVRLSAGALASGDRMELFVRTSCVTPEPSDFLPVDHYLDPDTDPVEEVAKLRAWVDDPSSADVPPTEMPLEPVTDEDQGS